MKLFNLMMSLSLCSTGLAITVSQSDWSGGAGVTTPVPQWTDSYYAGMQLREPAFALELIDLEPVERVKDSAITFPILVLN